MKILNGKELANKIKEEVKLKVETIAEKPCLAVIQVGNDPASSIYVNNKKKACEYCGIKSIIYNPPEDIAEEQLVSFVQALNNTIDVHGILVQLPLPPHIDEDRVVRCVNAEKDVDGFHELNIGKLVVGKETFIPCTAKGIIRLLQENNITIEGKNCVVVGRSDIVGKPTAMELLHLNGTVTICHSKTQNLEKICQEAEILICAIGQPKFFNRKYIAPGTVVVDAGIHRLEDGTMCGDVDFEDVKDIVSAITPVPGGVGPMTVAMLMENCIQAKK